MAHLLLHTHAQTNHGAPRLRRNKTGPRVYIRSPFTLASKAIAPADLHDAVVKLKFSTTVKHRSNGRSTTLILQPIFLPHLMTHHYVNFNKRYVSNGCWFIIRTVLCDLFPARTIFAQKMYLQRNISLERAFKPSEANRYVTVS
jgi:hypothetical protein